MVIKTRKQSCKCFKTNYCRSIKTLKGKILRSGFDTSSEVLGKPGAVQKEQKRELLKIIMARANIKENVLQRASEIDRPEKACLERKI